MMGRILQLPGYGKPVGVVEPQDLRVQAAGRGKTGYSKEFPEAFEAPSQHRKASLMLRVECAAKVIKERFPGAAFLDALEVLPLFRLGLLDEGDHLFREKAAHRIIFTPVNGEVASCRYQAFFNGLFKGNFLVFGSHQATLSLTSIFPVTAAVIRAERYSWSVEMD